MRPLLAILVAVVLAPGCASDRPKNREDSEMKTLVIQWQRLVDETGQTCQRCGLTEREVDAAADSLGRSLGPLDIRVVVEKSALAPETFARDTAQSNRLWIGSRTLEEWLGAKVGMSICGTTCADVAGPVECRTIEVDGQTYEAVPSALIVRAGLLAGAELLDAPPGEPCCKSQGGAQEKTPECCPAPTQPR